MMITENHAIEFLKQLFNQIIIAASPAGQLTAYLPASKPQGRVIVVGAGKAAAAMVKEWEHIWPSNYPPLQGIAVTRYGHSLKTNNIQILEASHPLPDAAGTIAAQSILNAVSNLNAEDQVFFLVSGGASALISLPANGITLADKQTLNRQLLHCGAPIEAINTVRKHLSRIKGGHLALAATPANITTLAISDVVGDDISSIGSGAAVPDPTTINDVWQIVQDYHLNLPKTIEHHLCSNQAETPKTLDNSQAYVVITPNQAFATVQKSAEQRNIEVLYLGDRINGEASEVAKVMAAIALHLRQQAQINQRPILLLSGGETTVTLKNPQGRGGRNSEFLLALTLALNSAKGIYALAADTDGIDGSEDNAGVWATPETLNKAQICGLNPHLALQNNQAYDFFMHLDQLLITGPTRTNINDFRAILIFP